MKKLCKKPQNFLALITKVTKKIGQLKKNCNLFILKNCPPIPVAKLTFMKAQNVFLPVTKPIIRVSRFFRINYTAQS